jgi:serine/threonine-protein kinase RsbW
VASDTRPPNLGGEDWKSDGRASPRCFRLSLEPALSEVAKARTLIERIKGVAGLPEDRAFDMKVALSEACANAIEHGRSRVDVAGWILRNKILLEVTSCGGFLPGIQADSESRRRGLGLPLMAALADQLHVARLEGGVTRVSLSFLVSTRVLDVQTLGPGSRAAGLGEAGREGATALERMATVVSAVAAAEDLAAAAATLFEGALRLAGCEGGMLRLTEGLERGSGWLPAIVHAGLSDKFLKDEALIRTDECMCGRVCSGLVDPSLLYFTPYGSFVWGEAQSLVERFGVETLGEVRGRCISEGFESVAIFPLTTPRGPVGALHLVDHAKNKFAETAAALEWGCQVCGPLMMRMGEAARATVVQEAIAALLR